jgi:hypothetical protein
MAQVTQAGVAGDLEVPLAEQLCERYAAFLRVIRLMFVEFDEIVADGDEVSDAEWARWSMEWSAEMGRLMDLTEARNAGNLTLYQEALLDDILAHLERERPRLVALRLTSPAIPAAKSAAMQR